MYYEYFPDIRKRFINVITIWQNLLLWATVQPDEKCQIKNYVLLMNTWWNARESQWQKSNLITETLLKQKQCQISH
jgi:hypothetical protein